MDKPNALSENELLRLKLLISTRECIEARYQAAVLQQRMQEREFHDHIAAHYQLAPGDEVNSDTGTITRKAKE